MAVYKVIQDIEAEDKLLGPLTLKGLVYAGITVLCGFINFKLLAAGSLGPIKWLLILVLLMPMVLFGVLASPLGREQPTEVWLLSRVRFFLKPRLRIWDQSGVKELVTITVPKKVIRQLTKNLSQSEVQSRLEALATTLDSRGWAVKNVNVNLSAVPDYFGSTGSSDRLIGTQNVAQEMPVIEVHAADDILDENNNPIAQKFQDMMVRAENQRRLAMQDRLETAKVEAAIAARQAEAEARNTQVTPETTTAPTAPTVAAKSPPLIVANAEPKVEEHAHTEKIHDLHPIYEIHRSAKTGAANRVTDKEQTDKLELVQSGNDLSVASIAKLANRQAVSGAISAIS